MTWLASCLLAALFAQALGPPLEAVRRGRQMAIVAVFGQTCLQVFDLGREQRNLLALPLDLFLLRAHLLLQVRIFLSQPIFFGFHSCTVIRRRSAATRKYAL